MKNTGCSLLLALLLCGCAASPAVVPFHYDNGPDDMEMVCLILFK